MGCNFYLKNDERHIGKRSAAGHYCWDCGVTLCRDGNDNIHGDGKWYENCPNCGTKQQDERLEESSAGRELGFNKKRPKAKKGVSSCSSFTWDIDPATLFEVSKVGGYIIRDEYGQQYSFQDFCDVLKECPIQFYCVGGNFT